MRIDFSNANISDLKNYEKKAMDAFSKLINKTGEGKEFTGWVERAENPDSDEIQKIKNASKKIREHSKVLVTIGIGGSYLGTKAIDYAFKSNFPKEDEFSLVYAGHNLSAGYLKDLLEYLDGKDYSINVISKSGTTTEPAIAFRFLKKHLEEKYGKEESKKRIFVTTDKSKGALKHLSDIEGYETFVVPDDIGGRFSVISAVGLLPLCASGVDIDKLLEGFKKGYEKYTLNSFENPAIEYAAYRYKSHEEGKAIEALVSYEPKLNYIAEWWKQLFAESEGKNHKGLFPVSLNNTTDLHSLGQMIQDGRRNVFETVLKVENDNKDLTITEDYDNLDQLNYLSGKTLRHVNDMAQKGTTIAHVNGGCDNILISLESISEQELGELLFFFEVVVATSGYMLEVNPFNQPGVEEYKKQMFKLLEKPGVN